MPKGIPIVRILGRTALAAALLALATPVRAQSTGSSNPDDVRPPYWETIGGFESDSHDTSYGFFGPQYNRPIRENIALSARVTGNYLAYEFDNGLGGRTSVRRPGITPSVGVRFGQRTTFKLTAGLGFRHRDEEITDGRGTVVSAHDEWDTAPGFGADLNWNPSRRDNIHAIAHYTAGDSGYMWNRVGYKRQVTNFRWRAPVTFYVGAEGITQGNDDLWSNMIGGLVETNFVRPRLSLMFRAGYKHTRFEDDDDNTKTGPYFGIGLYKRF